MPVPHYRNKFRIDVVASLIYTAERFYAKLILLTFYMLFRQ